MTDRSPQSIELITEELTDGHVWLRIADPSWNDPLDPAFAGVHGGRWNAPNSHPTLYLNQDVVTARLNLRAMAQRWPWEPEELRSEHAPILVQARLPRNQIVADAHTPLGLERLGLEPNYPFLTGPQAQPDKEPQIVGHDICQAIGLAVYGAGLRGVRCRSAQTRLGAGRELAWFPATARSRARRLGTLSFADWFWG